MPSNTVVENQPQAHTVQMVAQPGAAPADETPKTQQGDVEAQKPRLGMRGGGIVLDLCACFICCEACKGCCEAIDDCCCC